MKPPDHHGERAALEAISRTLDAHRHKNAHHSPVDRVLGATVALACAQSPDADARGRVVLVTVASMLAQGVTPQQIAQAVEQAHRWRENADTLGELDPVKLEPG